MDVSIPCEVWGRCRLCQMSRQSDIGLAISMRVCERLRSPKHKRSPSGHAVVRMG